MKRTGIMLCYPFEERRLVDPKFGWSWPVLVQPKLDGERMRAICMGKEKTPILLSSTEHKIISVPHIQRALQSLDIHAELDGELYIHGKDFSEIASIVSRTKNLHPDHSTMEYHVFDVINSDAQIHRSSNLQDMLDSTLLQSTKEIKIVQNHFCFCPEFLMDKYTEILALGYEGIVIRHLKAYYERKRSRFVMKFKPKKTDIYQIMSLEEGSGSHSGMVGAYWCQGSDNTLFKVSAGEFSHQERKGIWENRAEVVSHMLEISYQNLTKSGAPRFGLAKRILDSVPETDIYQSIL